MSLELCGVSAGYGDRLVLHETDLSLAPGDVVSVVGPNGAGKSTLVRVLAGLVRPRRGTATLDGTPLAALTRAALAHHVAVVPQSFETLFPFTVRELVTLGRTARLDVFGRGARGDAAAVARAIETLELGALADRRVDQLSGGERQRVVLAMALAQETAILLLDEPTVHLDPAHQLATIALVLRLARERGIAVLSVVHDLTLASLADRIVVLVDGRIVRDGPPLAVVDAPLVREVFGSGWHVAIHGGRPIVHPE